MEKEKNKDKESSFAPAFAKASADKKATAVPSEVPKERRTEDKEKGQEIIFDEVLLLAKGKRVEIGTPLVKGAKVIGKVISQGRNKKVIVFKYKPKTRYRVKRGHRQPFTEVEILKIED